MTGPRVLLLDGHALCYRAFFAVQELRNSKGQPTNAVFGFVNILKKIIKELTPAAMAICFDVSKDTHRRARFAAYKAQRSSMPEDLALQLPMIREIVRGYRIPIFEQEGFEADDILATLAVRFSKQGADVVIVTDDKDMCQLVGPGISVYHSRKDMLMGPAEVEARYGVPPRLIVDYLGLAGDSSDNIPGVTGVGEVTAKKLLQEFGSFDGIFLHADEIKGKMKDKIISGREQAVMSRELATLDRDVQVDCTLEDIRVQPRDVEALRTTFTALELRGSLRDLEASAPVVNAVFNMPEPAIAVMAALEASADVQALAASARKAGKVAFLLQQEDQESDLFPKVQIYAAAGGKAFQFDMAAFTEMKPLLEDEHVRKIVYDVKAFYKACSASGVVLAGEVVDVLLAGYVLKSGQGSFAIDALAFGYLGTQLPVERSMLHEAVALEAMEAPVFADLKEKHLDGLYATIEFPLSKVLFDIERAGVSIDTAILHELSLECDRRINEMTAGMYALAGGEFNLNSPKQLGVVLFEKLGLPVVKRTKTGFSTDEEVLTTLAPKHALPALVLEYRGLAKLKSTYIEALPKLVSVVTNRVHCSFEQTGTETGRLSSRHPNLQNIPVRTPMGRQIRKAFVASGEGRVLLSADYSQIELRVLAHLAQEPELMKAFHAGEDIHRYTAGLMFEVPLDTVTSEMRNGAKRINFGIIYGMSAFGLAKDLGIQHKEAQDFIDRYFLRYPGIKGFMDQEIDKARRDGYVTTMFHRRRYIPDISSKNGAMRQFAERQAINTPVQGSAADIIKLAMVNVHAGLPDTGLDATMIMTVHDELVFDVKKEDQDGLAAFVRRTMIESCVLDVPVKVTVKAGKNWMETDQL
ncbi:MAG: DNA polymerase I [Candidatus Omnitrophica bacterium]|nr:DNA polymerase I [Candidatus Omnitrophota bacterium]